MCINSRPKLPTNHFIFLDGCTLWWRFEISQLCSERESAKITALLRILESDEIESDERLMPLLICSTFHLDHELMCRANQFNTTSSDQLQTIAPIVITPTRIGEPIALRKFASMEQLPPDITVLNLAICLDAIATTVIGNNTMGSQRKAMRWFAEKSDMEVVRCK